MELLKCLVCGGDIVEAEPGIYKCASCGRIHVLNAGEVSKSLAPEAVPEDDEDDDEDAGGAWYSGLDLKGFKIEDPLSEFENIEVNGDFLVTDYIYLYAYRGTAKEVVIPDNVQIITNSVFLNDQNVEKVIFPEGLTDIYYSAFEGCKNLRSVEFTGSSLKRFTVDAFKGCTNLTDVYIRDLYNWYFVFFDTEESSPLYNGANLYVAGKLLTDVKITRYDSKEGLYAGVFNGCKSLKTVELPTGLTDVPEDGFENCTSLEYIVIPDRVVGILDAAFKGCASLKYVVLPQKLEFIDQKAFEGCTSLEAVYYKGSKKDWEKIDIDEDNIEDVKRYYYSETAPAKDEKVGYWHYADGKPISWS